MLSRPLLPINFSSPCFTQNPDARPYFAVPTNVQIWRKRWISVWEKTKVDQRVGHKSTALNTCELFKHCGRWLMKQKNNRSAGHVSWSNGPRITARVAAASNAWKIHACVTRTTLKVAPLPFYQSSFSYRRHYIVAVHLQINIAVWFWRSRSSMLSPSSWYVIWCRICPKFRRNRTMGGRVVDDLPLFAIKF